MLENTGGVGALLRSQSQETSRDMNLFQGLKGQFYVERAGSGPSQAARGCGRPVDAGGVLWDPVGSGKCFLLFFIWAARDI